MFHAHMHHSPVLSHQWRWRQCGIAFGCVVLCFAFATNARADVDQEQVKALVSEFQFQAKQDPLSTLRAIFTSVTDINTRDIVLQRLALQRLAHGTYNDTFAAYIDDAAIRDAAYFNIVLQTHNGSLVQYIKNENLRDMGARASKPRLTSIPPYRRPDRPINLNTAHTHRLEQNHWLSFQYPGVPKLENLSYEGVSRDVPKWGAPLAIYRVRPSSVCVAHTNYRPFATISAFKPDVASTLLAGAKPGKMADLGWVPGGGHLVAICNAYTVSYGVKRLSDRSFAVVKRDHGNKQEWIVTIKDWQIDNTQVSVNAYNIRTAAVYVDLPSGGNSFLNPVRVTQPQPTPLVNSNTTAQPSSNPQSGKEFYDRAEQRFGNGDWSGALADYQQAIKTIKNPDYVNLRGRIYLNTGKCQLRLGSHRDALTSFTEAIKFTRNGYYTTPDNLRRERPVPDLAESYNGRGDAKYAIGDYAGAITDWEQSIATDPDHAARRTRLEPYINAAKRKLNRHNRGASDRLAKEKQADDHYARGKAAFEQRGKYAEAKVHFDRAIAANPQHALAYAMRGRSKFYLKDYDGALADIRQAIRLQPNLERQLQQTIRNIEIAQSRQ